MNKKKLIVFILIVCSLAAAVYAAVLGSVTETLLKPIDGLQNVCPGKITLDWTSDANGFVDGLYTSVPIDGEIYRIVTIPDAASATDPNLDTDPNDVYDILLKDNDGIDVLLGLGANEPNGANGHFTPLTNNGTQYYGRVATRGLLELEVSEAGNANGGKVIIYWK